MTKVIEVKGCDISIEMSDTTFAPFRKKPTLAIRKGNEVVKVASFNNWNSVLYFANELGKMFSQLSLLTRQQEQDFVIHRCEKLGIDYNMIFTCNSES